MDEDRLASIGKQMSGSIKEAVGEVTGDVKVQAESTAKKTAGKAQNAMGGAKNSVGTQSRNKAMSGKPRLPAPSPAVLAQRSADAVEGEVLALHAERVAVSKRVRRTLVLATLTTKTRDAVVKEDLAREQVVVERVPSAGWSKRRHLSDRKAT